MIELLIIVLLILGIIAFSRKPHRRKHKHADRLVIMVGRPEPK